MYPVAGGLYSIVHRVLGRPIGFLALVDYIAQGVFLPASIALGVGTYLHALNDSIPVNLSSAIAMAAVTLLAVLRIHVGAILVAIFLTIEVVVIVVVAVAGFTHWNQPWSILSHPVIFDGSALSPVSLGAVVAALAITMFSPFEPASHGWTKTTYRRGDILDREAVDALVADADVAIHLAFIVMGSREESERVNLAGTRTVFESTVAAERVTRLVYTSSVAAYGYHSDNPVPLTEDVPPRGSPEHYYSAQKAACEAALAEITAGSSLEVFVLRPCIVAGPKATALADAMPWNWLPAPVRTVTRALPILKPPFPDPGFPLQLVHHDDVATAIALCASTSAPAGVYNIAGDGEISVSEMAAALGARPVRMPAITATAASAVIAHLPFAPSALEWLHIARTSMVMDISKAKSVLGWTPKYTTAETLNALAAAL